MSSQSNKKLDTSFNAVLRDFERIEANLEKLDKLWAEYLDLDEGDPDYDKIFFDLQFKYLNILSHLPPIDGEKPSRGLVHYREIPSILSEMVIDHQIDISQISNAPNFEVGEYKLKFGLKRRQLVRNIAFEIIDKIDSQIKKLRDRLTEQLKREEPEPVLIWDNLKDYVKQLDTLLGGSFERTRKWNDLRRHLSFGELQDFYDIESSDWPILRSQIEDYLYPDSDPIPVGVGDLSSLVANKPEGPVITTLLWDNLSASDFERLIFNLISQTPGYENPEWLANTNATDKGRDLSVNQIIIDPLSGTSRNRTIIQCKHWLRKSVSVTDIAALVQQLVLWEPPRIDVCVIATSGRFSSDAISWVEKHNQSNNAMRIQMWPESHIESILSSRPALIAEFNLR